MSAALVNKLGDAGKVDTAKADSKPGHKAKEKKVVAVSGAISAAAAPANAPAFVATAAASGAAGAVAAAVQPVLNPNALSEADQKGINGLIGDAVTEITLKLQGSMSTAVMHNCDKSLGSRLNYGVVKSAPKNPLAQMDANLLKAPKSTKHFHLAKEKLLWTLIKTLPDLTAVGLEMIGNRASAAEKKTCMNSYILPATFKLLKQLEALYPKAFEDVNFWDISVDIALAANAEKVKCYKEYK